MTISANLRELRTSKDMTQEQIARKLQVKRPRYAAWEEGRNKPSIDHLIPLSKAFGCTVDEILGVARDCNKA